MFLIGEGQTLISAEVSKEKKHYFYMIPLPWKQVSHRGGSDPICAVVSKKKRLFFYDLP